MNLSDCLKQALKDAEFERDILAIERQEVTSRFDAQIEAMDAEIRGIELSIARYDSRNNERSEVG